MFVGDPPQEEPEPLMGDPFAPFIVRDLHLANNYIDSELTQLTYNVRAFIYDNR